MAHTRKFKKLQANCLLFTLLGLASTQPWAAPVEITARFSPDPTNVGANTFVNTTPISGDCAAYPGICTRAHMFSFPSLFYPAYYVNNGRAALHFDVAREGVAQITEHAGSEYSGNVSRVWDSEA